MMLCTCGQESVVTQTALSVGNTIRRRRVCRFCRRIWTTYEVEGPNSVDGITDAAIAEARRLIGENESLRRENKALLNALKRNGNA
jgi:hypothetical protein